MERVADAIERIRAHATSVSIVGQGITDDDVKRLTAVLATSDCVTELNLACNRCALVQPCVASEQSGSLSLQDNRRGVQGTGPSSRETQAAETSGLEQQSDRSARFGGSRSHTSAPTGNFSVLQGVNHLRVVIPLSNIETLNVVGNNISVRIFGALQVMLMRTYVQLWSQGWVNSEVQKWVKDNVVRKREQQGTRAACARHDVSVTANTFAAGRVGRPAPLPSDATRCAYTTWTRANH